MLIENNQILLQFMKVNFATILDELVVWEKRQITFLIWAATRENLFLPFENNKGADQPAHPRSLISTFVVRSLDSIIPLDSISEISKSI